MLNLQGSYCLLTCMFSRFSLHSASNLILTLICAEKIGCCHFLLEPYMAETITFLRGCLFRVSKFGYGLIEDAWWNLILPFDQAME